jgi:membrane protease subunit (stomatin/prohibitin family)
MPLLRGIARTAVIAGTATSVSNRVSRRQAGRWAAKDQHADDEQQQAPQQQPAAPAEDGMSAKLHQLKELGELKTQGVINDDEFAEQKSKILAS